MGKILKFMFILIIAAAAYYGYQYYLTLETTHDAEITLALEEMKRISEDINRYARKFKTYPKSFQEMRESGIVPETGWPPPDPWNGEYFIEGDYIKCLVNGIHGQELKYLFKPTFEWDVKYKCEVLPDFADPKWTKLGSSSVSIENNTLVIDDNKERESLFYWLIPPHFEPSPDQGYTIDFGLKLRPENTADVSVRIYDGQCHSTISFYPGYLLLKRGDHEVVKRYEVSNCRKMSNYRIWVKKADISCFVDGELLFEQAGVHTWRTNDIQFGFGCDIDSKGKAWAKWGHIYLSYKGLRYPEVKRE